MTLGALRPEYVQYVPEVLEDGVLYVSRQYEVIVHLCRCGCGDHSVTPIDDGGWTYDEDTVTLNPSILNLRCRAHYWIRNGEVVWA